MCFSSYSNVKTGIQLFSIGGKCVCNFMYSSGQGHVKHSKCMSPLLQPIHCYFQLVVPMTGIIQLLSIIFKVSIVVTCTCVACLCLNIY